MCTERNMLVKMLKDIGMSETYSPVIMAAFDKYVKENGVRSFHYINANIDCWFKKYFT